MSSSVAGVSPNNNNDSLVFPEKGTARALQYVFYDHPVPGGLLSIDFSVPANDILDKWMVLVLEEKCDYNLTTNQDDCHSCHEWRGDKSKGSRTRILACMEQKSET